MKIMSHSLNKSEYQRQETHTHTQPFTAVFPGPPGWAGARRELLDFMVQGED